MIVVVVIVVLGAILNSLLCFFWDKSWLGAIGWAMYGAMVVIRLAELVQTP